MRNDDWLSISSLYKEVGYTMHVMDTANAIDIDSKRMHAIYDRWPEYFLEAASTSINTDHDSSYYKSVVFCGMGGSGTACDVMNDLMRTFGSVPSVIARGKIMPSFVNKYSLVIVNSVSGNTEEAVLMMEEARSKGAEVISVSAGGKLKEISEAYGTKHVNIANLSVPRASLPHLIMPDLRIIEPFLKESVLHDVQEMYRYLAKIRDQISISALETPNTSRNIAKFLESGLPFCFASPSLASVATRFKNSLNENAKIHCLRDSILEASHNEIVPFTFNNQIQPRVLLLGWDKDSALVKKRFEKITFLLRKIGYPIKEFISDSATMFEAIISSIYVLDYASIYMAISRSIDPSPTPAIDILKNPESFERGN